MLTLEQKQQFSDILEELGKSLDITETQFNTAVKSYQAVGILLAKEDSLLAMYEPVIQPQGSFMLQTMIKPISDEDDLDIDLICELTNKNPLWTQNILKQKVGDQLKSNDFYKDLLLIPDSRRCWTLKYREKADNPKERYHLDILPCFVDQGYKMLIEKTLRNVNDLTDTNNLAIRITDKERIDYYTETDHKRWQRSNPLGYGKWFYNRAIVYLPRILLLSEAIHPVPKYQSEKLPLQRVIQILKRHRDIMYQNRDDKDDKPISIIITTLASLAYNGEVNIIDALVNIIPKMKNFIAETNPKTGETMKWVGNPVDDSENFADKWRQFPARKDNFYEWLKKVEEDINNLIEQREKGLLMINESLSKPFGKDAVSRAFSTYGEALLKRRESGELKMAGGTGMLGSIGTTVKNHHFHGEE